MDGSPILWLEVLVLPLDHAGAGAARDFASTSLEWHDLAYLEDRIRLVVSELVTNALMHASQPPVIVSMQEQWSNVLVTVSDTSATLPVRPAGQERDLGGCGVAIVERLSREWGSNTRLDGGKSVWASFEKKPRGIRHQR